MIDRIFQFDEALFLQINMGMKNDLFNFLLPKISLLAEPHVLVLLCVIFYIFGQRKAKISSVLVMLTLGCSILIAWVLKDVINVSRPLGRFEEIKLIGSPSFILFPSVHAMGIAIFATALSCKYKRFMVLFIILVLLVAVSRIYMGHNFPSDIVIGILSGFFMAKMFLGVEDLFKKIFGSDETNQED
ncbi:phosphatase PAP2 family protein [Candidatus Omnitrophota bacterium]